MSSDAPPEEVEEFEQPTPVVVGETDGSDEDDEMANERLDSLMEQNMGQLAQSGVVAQNNFITVSKAQDYDYLENKRMVTLDEAIGAREVASEVNPGGPRKPGSND